MKLGQEDHKFKALLNHSALRVSLCNLARLCTKQEREGRGRGGKEGRQRGGRKREEGGEGERGREHSGIQLNSTVLAYYW